VRVCVAVADEEGVCSRTWSKDLARESQRITADSTEPVRTQWLTGEGRGGEEKQVNKIIIIKTGPFLVSRENSSKKKTNYIGATKNARPWGHFACSLLQASHATL
jgi:hypothetical protein